MQNFPGAPREVVARSCSAKGSARRSATGPSVCGWVKKETQQGPRPPNSRLGLRRRNSWRAEAPTEPLDLDGGVTEWQQRRRCNAPPRVLLKQGRLDLQRIPPRAAPASVFWPDELTRSPKLQSRRTGPPGTAPRARASYGTPKRRAPRYRARPQRQTKGTDDVETAAAATAPLALRSI